MTQPRSRLAELYAERYEIVRFAITLSLVGLVLSWAQRSGGTTWEPLWLSLRVALAATVGTLVVGIALAVLLMWKRLPGRDLVDALVSVPLVLPPTVLGYYLIVSMGPESTIGRAWQTVTGDPLIFTFEAAVIAAAVGSLPLVVRSVKLGLEAIDPSYLAAARTLGAGPVRVFLTISLPLAMPGVIAGAMMGFARALGDYGATMMFASARPHEGIPTGSIAVMDYLVANQEGAARRMGIVMTVVGVAMLYLANRLTRRMGRRG
jgi:molybdate transport system permease protein